MQISKVTLAGILFIGLNHVANASPVGAVTLLDQYNLITSGDVTSYSEVDGNALIGGNLNGGTSNYHIHTTSTAVPALTVAGNINSGVNVNGPGLNVGGNVSGSVNMNGGGDAYIGSVSGFVQNNANGSGSTSIVGDISGTVNTNGGDTTYGGTLTGGAYANGGGTVSHQTVTPPFDPATRAADAINTLNQFSGQLARQAANSIYTLNGNRVTFNATADSNGLATFNISDAANFFNTAGEFDFNLNGAQSVLFNVYGDGSDLNIHANFLASAATNWGSKFLWNFLDTGQLTISAQFGGSVLAMGSNVINYGNLEGTLVAKGLEQHSEIHSQPLSFDPPAAVPLPASAPLLLSGLLGLFSFARRNRKEALVS